MSPSRDGGFTVVEVVIAAVLLAITAIAVFGLVDAASRNNFRSQQSQVVNDRLQQEMERVKQVPYDQLALNSLPPIRTLPMTRTPGSRGRRSTSAQREQLRGPGLQRRQLSGGGRNGERRDARLRADVVSKRRVKGSIYRYVTWQHDDACGNCGQDWYKHVVIAVALDPTASGSTRTYQELQGNLSNPNAGLSKCPTGSSGCTNPGGPDPTPWTFWLTDTPCNFAADASRSPAIT